MSDVCRRASTGPVGKTYEENPQALITVASDWEFLLLIVGRGESL